MYNPDFQYGCPAYFDLSVHITTCPCYFHCLLGLLLQAKDGKYQDSVEQAAAIVVEFFGVWTPLRIKCPSVPQNALSLRQSTTDDGNSPRSSTVHLRSPFKWRRF